MMHAVALVWALIIGWLAIRLSGVARDWQPRWAALVLEISLGAGLGAALTSCLFVALLAGGAADRWTAVIAEAIIAAILAVLSWRSRSKTSVTGETVARAAGWRWTRILAAVVAVILLMVLAAQIDSAAKQPFGEFDAFAIWSARARFLLGPGETWQRAFSPMLEKQHPEYPLLLSAFVARTWRWSGDESQGAAPAGASMLFFWASSGVLLGALTILRGPPAGLLALLVMVTNTTMPELSKWHYADIPTSLFFLGCLALLLLGAQGGTNSIRVVYLAMSGLFASFAAMTKDEGIPFLLAVPCLLALIEWRSAGLRRAFGSVGPWLAGAAPGALLQAYFKLAVAPPTEGPSMAQALEFLMQPGRYGIVVTHLLSEALKMGSGIFNPLLLLGILALTLRFEIPRTLRRYLVLSGWVLGVELLAYCAVYLTTTDDIVWRLDTSLARLYAQIWPSFLLLAFLVLRTPRDPDEAGAIEKAPRPGKKRRKRS